MAIRTVLGASENQQVIGKVHILPGELEGLAPSTARVNDDIDHRVKVWNAIAF